MTPGTRPTIDELALAKALHPARRTWPQPPETGGTGGEPRAASPPADMLAVLWDEAACRVHLAPGAHGWLFMPSRHARLPVTIAAIEGSDIMLVAPGTGYLNSVASEAAARLEVVGVTSDLCRWVTRATGAVQPAVSSEFSSARADRFRHGGADSVRHSDFSVLAFSAGCIRGFQSSRLLQES